MKLDHQNETGGTVTVVTVVTTVSMVAYNINA